MKYHVNAKTTVHQRSAMRHEFLAGASPKDLSRRYMVSAKSSAEMDAPRRPD